MSQCRFFPCATFCCHVKHISLLAPTSHLCNKTLIVFVDIIFQFLFNRPMCRQYHTRGMIVFTTWCYVLLRSLLSRGVHLSVTLVQCVQTMEDIVKLLSQPGSPMLLVFWPRVPIPSSARAQYLAMGKFCSFRLKSPFISETVRHRPMVAMGR